MYLTDTKANETTSECSLVRVCTFGNGSRRLPGRFDKLSEDDCRHQGEKGGNLAVPWHGSSAKDPNTRADITKKLYDDFEERFSKE